MHAQSVHGNPIVGGYVSRHAPEALRNYEIPVIRQLWIPTPDVLAELSFSDVVHQAPLQERIGEVLDAYGLRYVVLHLDASRSQEVARLKDLLSSAFPPSAVLWEDERILAYRIPRMPARTGIGVGMGVDWGPVQRLPENGLQYRWSKGDANVVAMLLDASPREAILNASVLSTRKRQQVELDLNGTPRARLSLAREPQSIRLRLFLKPGYNVLRFRSVGVPSSRDDEGRFLFGLGRLSLVPEVNRGS
jgi:hypothetical protein